MFPARLMLDEDLHYSRQVSAKDAASISEPDDVIYRIRKYASGIGIAGADSDMFNLL